MNQVTLEDLIKANEVLRSAYQVAVRQGRDTNWEAFTTTVENELKRQHEIIYPKKHE